MQEEKKPPTHLTPGWDQEMVKEHLDKFNATRADEDKQLATSLTFDLFEQTVTIAPKVVDEAAPSSENVQPLTVVSFAVRSVEPPAVAACRSAMVP